LTVRDAAVLAAPTDALLVELEALHADDISRFVSFYRPEAATLAERLRRVIEARPDERENVHAGLSKGSIQQPIDRSGQILTLPRRWPKAT
jgi:hypothetical protein